LWKVQVSVHVDGDIGQVVRQDGREDVVVHTFSQSVLWSNV
jgi:hypothetical protein